MGKTVTAMSIAEHVAGKYAEQGAVLVFLGLMRLLRGTLARTGLALLGLVLVTVFVVIRAAGFHHMDVLIDTRVAGMRMNWLLELPGPLMVLAAALRGDGTSPATVEFARMKAYTARVRNQTSQEFAAATASGDRMALRQIPGVVAIGGGVPIRAGSETIGAIGVSGAPGGDKDEICAQAGIATVAAGLN